VNRSVFRQVPEHVCNVAVDASTEFSVDVLELDELVRAVHAVRDERRIAGVYPDGRLVFWDINQPDSPVIISYDVNTTKTGLWAMEILPDGRLLISAAKDQEEGNALVTIELVTPPAS